MSSEETPPPQEDGIHGCGCSCETPVQPDSTTQRHRPTTWDTESLEAFNEYNKYMLESLKNNFERVMALARRVAAVEQERALYCWCSHGVRRW